MRLTSGLSNRLTAKKKLSATSQALRESVRRKNIKNFHSALSFAQCIFFCVRVGSRGVVEQIECVILMSACRKLRPRSWKLNYREKKFALLSLESVGVFRVRKWSSLRRWAAARLGRARRRKNYNGTHRGLVGPPPYGKCFAGRAQSWTRICAGKGTWNRLWKGRNSKLLNLFKFFFFQMVVFGKIFSSVQLL